MENINPLYFFPLNSFLSTSFLPISFLPSKQSLNDKEFIFKVEFRCDDIKDLEPSFRVVDVCQDALVVSEFKKANPNILSVDVYISIYSIE